MKITPRFKFASGSFDTDTAKLTCVSQRKYGDVELCLKSKSLIPLASIKLYDTGLAVDADATFEEAKLLGDEIARRWNAGIKKETEQVESPDINLVKIIASACLKYHDSGETSVNLEARVILEELTNQGYSIIKNEAK